MNVLAVLVATVADVVPLRVAVAPVVLAAAAAFVVVVFEKGFNFI